MPSRDSIGVSAWPLLALQDPEATPLLAPLPDDERLTSWRLARRDGRFVSHLGVRGRAPDAIYGALAGRRDVLGRIVPDGPAPRRYP